MFSWLTIVGECVVCVACAVVPVMVCYVVVRFNFDMRAFDMPCEGDEKND